MRITFIFGAILACSILGFVISDRSAKTIFLVLSGMLAIYGLLRLIHI